MERNQGELTQSGLNPVFPPYIFIADIRPWSLVTSVQLILDLRTLVIRSVTSSFPSSVTATPFGQTSPSAITEHTFLAMSTSRSRCPTESATTNVYGATNATSQGSSTGLGRAPVPEGGGSSGINCHSRSGFVSRPLMAA